MKFKINFHATGAHVRCQLFVRPSSYTFVLAGEFVLRPEEFEALQEAFPQAEFVAIPPHFAT